MISPKSDPVNQDIWYHKIKLCFQWSINDKNVKERKYIWHMNKDITQKRSLKQSLFI